MRYDLRDAAVSLSRGLRGCGGPIKVMCGLCVELNLAGEPVDASQIDLMLDAMRRRGPDARGTFVEGNIGLGHVRLSILDLDVRSDQPMRDEAGRVIVFNGEIYNHEELRRALDGPHRFRTTSDTEVALAAYAAWGVDCFERFNGDWAIAILDPTQDRLVLSRDRFGIKPLFIARSGGRIRIASTVGAILASGHPARLSGDSVAGMLRRGKPDPGTGSWLEGIDAVEPGTCLVMDRSGQARQHRYWGEDDVFGADVPEAYEEAVETFGELLADAVRLRLAADVPVGVCLSGGLDSSLIVGLGAGVPGQGPIRTYSGIATGHPSDESAFARAMVEHAGTVPQFIELDLDGFIRSFPAAVIAQESVLGSVDTVARWLVLERASRDVTVLLDGQGGDELLAGYPRMHRRLKDEDLRRRFVARVATKPPRSDIEPLMELASELRANRAGRSRTRPTTERSLDPVTLQQYESLHGAGLRSLLHTEDRLTMGFSMEGRVPFLDHRLVSMCFSAPLSFRIQNQDKRMARDFARRHQVVPRAIHERLDKRGFDSPFAELLRSEPGVTWLKGMFEGLVRSGGGLDGLVDQQVVDMIVEGHARGPVDESRRLVRLISLGILLERWQSSIA